MIRKALLAVLVLVAVGLAAWFAWAMFINDPRRDIDLSAWVNQDDAFHRELMPGARWATQELCGDELPCIQAVRSETLTMYRFTDRDEAEAATQRFGEDGYLTGWIVVRFEPAGLTPQQRDKFEYSVGCINTWVSEDGRDC